MNRLGFISLSIFILLLPLNLFGETDSIKGKAVFCSFNEGYLNIYKRTKECNAEGFYFETEDTVKVMSIKNETENFNSPPPDENGYNRCATSCKLLVSRDNSFCFCLLPLPKQASLSSIGIVADIL